MLNLLRRMCALIASEVAEQQTEEEDRGTLNHKYSSVAKQSEQESSPKRT